VDQAARLSARSHPRGWSDWETATGLPRPSGAPRELAHLHFVLDAALAGLRAAVLPWTLVEEAIRAKLRLAPYGFVRDGGALAAVRMTKDTPAPVRRLITWLHIQAG
jgi:DNA-binding transcriptional LysR family regulator